MRREAHRAHAQVGEEAEPFSSLSLSLRYVEANHAGAHISRDRVYEKMFGLVDVDDSGEITAREFAAALKKLGQEMTVDDVMEVAKDVDNDESGDLAIEEFKTLMASLDI